MKRICFWLPLVLAIICISCGSLPEPKDVEVNSDIEGDVAQCLGISEDEATLEFSDAKEPKASTTLTFEAKTALPVDEVEITVAVLDDEENTITKLKLADSKEKDSLLSLINSGKGSAEIKFSTPANHSLSKEKLKKLSEQAVSLKVIKSELHLTKSPKELQAERDSAAIASMPQLELSDFLQSPRKEEGFSGTVQDMRGANEIISNLQAKGYEISHQSSKKVRDEIGFWSDNGFYTEEHTDLKRQTDKDGGLVETVTIVSGPTPEVTIDFFNTECALELMKKFTAAGYRNGVSSDCYYMGSQVKRGGKKGKKVTITQLWEP